LFGGGIFVQSQRFASKAFYFEKSFFLFFAITTAAEVKTHTEREIRNTFSSQKNSLLFKKIRNSSAKLPIT